MQKRPQIDYDSATISKNALGIWYESRTIFRIRDCVAKVLNSTIQPRIQIFVDSCRFVGFGACVE